MNHYPPLPSKPSHLLVVGDDLSTAQQITLQLQPMGYRTIDIASTAEKALMLVQQCCPELVLMDIELNHETDGISLAEQIQQQFDLPVIFLISPDKTPLLANVRQGKTVGYLFPPFTARELDTTLEMTYFKYHAEKNLLQLTQKNQALLDNMIDGLISIDNHGIVGSINHAAAVMFGYSADEVLGNNVSMLMADPHRSHHDEYLQHFHQTGEARIIGKPRDLEGRRKDGSLFPLTLAVTQYQFASNVAFIGVIRDITRLRHDENEIRKLASYDELTGLPNRRNLLERVKHAMLASQRTGLHGAILLLDLDHFKLINDTMGHPVGDELLCQTSERLHTCLHEEDCVARLGGDEFAILLEGLSTLDYEAARQAENLAKKVLDVLASPYQLTQGSHQITASIGIVVFLQEQENVNELLKKADVAMYQAKSDGRNTVRFFDPGLQALANAYLTLKQAMQRGILEHQFVLHYQIQVDCARQITGVEALIRWRHPEQGMIGPSIFIPIAEESGLILPLGQWVMEEACRQLAIWSSDPVKSAWTISVNVSASQFAHPDFVKNVFLALSITGAPPYKLKLELTESMLVKDVDAVIIKMLAILAEGVQFSLDDFGTGYSSLTYLKRLPLSQLKIDQSFVRDILVDRSGLMIANTILALGHNLQMQVMAEGVETIQQYQLLRETGCDAFQGYYFGRPCHPEQLPN